MREALQIWQAYIAVNVIFGGVFILFFVSLLYLGAYLIKQYYSTCTCWI